MQLQVWVERRIRYGVRNCTAVRAHYQVIAASESLVSFGRSVVLECAFDANIWMSGCIIPRQIVIFHPGHFFFIPEFFKVTLSRVSGSLESLFFDVLLQSMLNFPQ